MVGKELTFGRVAAIAIVVLFGMNIIGSFFGIGVPVGTSLFLLIVGGLLAIAYSIVLDKPLGADLAILGIGLVLLIGILIAFQDALVPTQFLGALAGLGG